MSVFKAIIDDLREKHLWPVALVLITGLIAVPLVLAKAATTHQLQPLPYVATPPVDSATAIPVVAVQSLPSQTDLPGPGRDPFAQPPSSSPANNGTGSAFTGAGSSASTGPAASHGSSSGSRASSTSNKTSTSKGSPSGGSSSTSGQSQSAVSVDLSFGEAGSVRTYRAVVPLTSFPSSSNPVLAFLGVMADHKTAMFVLSATASTAGGGSCLPARAQCTFLQLKVGQRERIAVVSGSGTVTTYFLKLNAITDHSATEERARSSSAPSSPLLGLISRIFR